MLFPALALALPVVATAAPLQQAADPSQWGGQQLYEQTYEPGGKTDVSLETMIEMCQAVQILATQRACLESTRATGEQMIVCDARGGKIPVFPGQEPIFPGQEQIFPGQAQVTPEQVYPGQEPFYPDQSDEGGLIFVDIAQCTALGIDIDMNR
ncbi:MAG TPA: hypothetical protein VIK91_09195 [Nannocystis sp.]